MTVFFRGLYWYAQELNWTRLTLQKSIISQLCELERLGVGNIILKTSSWTQDSARCFWPHSTKLQLSICAERNIIGRKPTSLMRSITSFARSATSFICAEKMRNDVLAALEMMLTFGQTILCLRHKWKNPSLSTWIFWCSWQDLNLHARRNGS